MHGRKGMQVLRGDSFYNWGEERKKIIFWLGKSIGHIVYENNHDKG
jgi:hypothetical protein